MPQGNRLRSRVELGLDADDLEFLTDVAERLDCPVGWVAEALVCQALDSEPNGDVERRIIAMKERRGAFSFRKPPEKATAW